MNISIGKKMSMRAFVVMSFFLFICVIAIVVRLAQMQIVEHEFYQGKAISQQTRDAVVSPSRGTIYDRNMNQLALSASVETVVINPRSVKDDAQAKLIASGLSEILGVDEETILKKTGANNYYEIIKRKVEKEDADRVREFKKEHSIRAIDLIEDTKRYYPYGSLAAHVIGFTDTDGVGIEGLEAKYNEVLTGSPGRIISAKNASGTDMLYEYEKYIDAQDGLSLVLTIDQVIQKYVEKHLANAVIENKVGNRATCIVMDVNTGEILAMSTMPDYDLNSPRVITDEGVLAELEGLSGSDYTARQLAEWQKIWRNKAIADTYEPGSVFKIITATIAIEENLIPSGARFSCPGYYMIGNQRIRCWKRTGHGVQTFEEAIQNSCNPAFMQIGLRIGPERMHKYIQAFGLTEKTGIDLYGESSGLNFTAEQLAQYNQISLATTSFGQTFTVTPMELASAIAAAVNGGNLYKPYLVKEVRDSLGNVVETYGPTSRRQVVSKETSVKISSMLELVVSKGTGKNAYVPGYRIGGKTGTSEKIAEKNEEGQVDKFIASFAGIAPSDNPQILVLLLLDEPNGASTGGGAAAAPVVRKIMADVLPYIGVSPQYTEEELAKLDLAVPDVSEMATADAQKAIRDAGFVPMITGSGDTVVAQMPRSTQRLAGGGRVILYTEPGEVSELVKVPSVGGMSYSQASRTLQNAGLNMKALGNDVTGSTSVAKSQSIEADQVVEKGSIISVDFVHTSGVE